MLKEYVVETENGERRWMAEDAAHAMEQHYDAFMQDGINPDPGERITHIFLAMENGP